MNPKEKAKELVEIYVDVNEFYNLQNNNIVVINYNFAKQCALIAVFQIFEVVPDKETWEYWVAVKKEIELL
jgi:hypothetical protein